MESNHLPEKPRVSVAVKIAIHLGLFLLSAWFYTYDLFFSISRRLLFTLKSLVSLLFRAETKRENSTEMRRLDLAERMQSEDPSLPASFVVPAEWFETGAACCIAPHTDHAFDNHGACSGICQICGHPTIPCHVAFIPAPRLRPIQFFEFSPAPKFS